MTTRKHPPVTPSDLCAEVLRIYPGSKPEVSSVRSPVGLARMVLKLAGENTPKGGWRFTSGTVMARLKLVKAGAGRVALIAAIKDEAPQEASDLESLVKALQERNLSVEVDLPEEAMPDTALQLLFVSGADKTSTIGYRPGSKLGWEYLGTRLPSPKGLPRMAQHHHHGF